jgi:hypothetical protein
MAQQFFLLALAFVIGLSKCPPIVSSSSKLIMIVIIIIVIVTTTTTKPIVVTTTTTTTIAIHFKGGPEVDAGAAVQRVGKPAQRPHLQLLHGQVVSI